MNSHVRQCVAGVKKTKKKKKAGGASHHHHHKGFKMSKGYNIFKGDLNGGEEELPEGFSEEDIVTHVAGKKPLLGKVMQIRYYLAFCTKLHKL